jgi:thioredoxin 1
MPGHDTFAFTDSGFDREVLRSDVPVLVDFWGEGCPPRRQLAPTIDVVASEYAGRLKVGKLDVGANGETAMRYRIRSVPTLLYVQGRAGGGSACSRAGRWWISAWARSASPISKR